MTTSAEPISARVRLAIRAQIDQRRVRQVDLARVLGVSQAQVSERLRGNTPFTLDDVGKVAAFLGVPPAELLEPALLVDESAVAS